MAELLSADEHHAMDLLEAELRRIAGFAEIKAALAGSTPDTLEADRAQGLRGGQQ